MVVSVRSAFLAAALSIGVCLPALADGPARRVVVSGEGSVEAAPDYAEITIGATTTGAVARDVMAENAKSVTDIIAAAKGLGVEPKDIKTSTLTIYPVTGSSSSGVTGYRATNTVQIDLRDLSKIGDLVDKTVGKGANTISGVAFLQNDPDGLLDKARPAAFADAKRKAEIYAQASGAKLGRLLELTEGVLARPRPYFQAAMAASAAKVATPVETGENKLTVGVTATFELTD